MKKNHIPAIILTAGILIAILLFDNTYAYALRDLFNNIIYLSIIYTILGLSLLFWLLDKKNLYNLSSKKLRILFLLFLPIFILPLFRCYFRIPYIFCQACPRKCAWGHTRRFILPMALLINIDNRFWCRHCPIGLLQTKLNTYHKSLDLNAIKYPFLAIIILLFLLGYVTGLSNIFFTDQYITTIPILGLFILFLVISIITKRPWCKLCPISSSATLINKDSKK